MTDQSRDEIRAEALARFARALEIPDIDAIRQRGRDPVTAHFTFHFTDSRTVRVGTVKTLWSQTELAKVLLTAIGRVPKPLKAGDWRDLLAVLATYCIEVEEVDGETFTGDVAEWLSEYLETAALGAGRADAAAQNAPFRENDQIHIHAQHFAKYIRREHHEQISLQELRQALVDLDYERKTVWYQRGDRATTKSYYVADSPADDAAGQVQRE